MPEVWSAGGVAASRRFLPFAEGTAGVRDSRSVDRSAHRQHGLAHELLAIATDGVHAALAVASPPDTVVAPGVLLTAAIGSPPIVAIHENSNHFLQVHGISPDGSTVLFSDKPTMGGYAGITLSADYGLFTLSAGHRTQDAHFSGTDGGYVGAAYLNGTDFVVIAEIASPGSSQATLMRSTGGGRLVPLDTATGGVAFVYVVTAY